MEIDPSLEERAPDDVIQLQIGMVKNQESLASIINANPSILLVLNKFRQVIYANEALLEFLDLKRFDDIYGMRPGEILQCEHASERPEGCGTTEFCKTCGALNAILTSQNDLTDIQECRIIQKDTGEALDLRVWTTPLSVDEEQFTIFALQDISNEKRRALLERIFFHDILNTAGNIRNYAILMKNAPSEEIQEFIEDLRRLSEGLIDEIQSQREITRAENGELTVKPVLFKPSELIEDVTAMYHRHETATGKKIEVNISHPGLSIISDPTLLRRILGNMIKNALEASQPGDTITIACEPDEKNVYFRVSNPSVIPPLVQLQIFQRSFSTKGTGRGLGTYSIKLLGERYLGGRVTFHSGEGTGTIFCLSLPQQI